MTKATQIHYEPHPVSALRKAELRAQGLTIVDAVFAPAGFDQGEVAGEGSLPPAWANTPDGKHVLLGDMTQKELQALAKQYGVEVHHKAGVDKLIDAIQTAFAVKDAQGAAK